MTKRRRQSDDGESDRAVVKKGRIGPKRTLASLSDELIVRILSYLPVQDLLRMEGTSKRFQPLANDDEVWKGKYYDAWIKSRYRRLPPTQRPEKSRQLAKAVEWLEHSQRVKSSAPTNWKRQYKIKSNWHVGAAQIREVQVAPSTVPPVIGKMFQNQLFTVDSTSGLRCWQQQDGTRVLRAHREIEDGAQPTCMAVEEEAQAGINILVGFSDGRFALYRLTHSQHLSLLFSQQSDDGPLVAVDLAMPFIMTTSITNSLTIYSSASFTAGEPTSLQALTKLQSDAKFGPTSVSLRKQGLGMIASIAYGFKRIGAGWCIGIQEISLTPIGTSGVEDATERWEIGTRSTSSLPLPAHPQQRRPPQSLSYAHPFVIASLADNTIMSFLVTSTENQLEMSRGRRLWGHTAGISSVQVNSRGKAVSISQRGNEIRVWELEDVMTMAAHRRTSVQVKVVGSAWAQITAALAQRAQGLGLAVSELRRGEEITRGRWVGFDEEQVVVLGERASTQVMSLYDFT
ncbi:hypothetical protein B0A52_08997 [Exophiala mesophila]|uniref:Probable E3 ubiquitin ligase complex SCF subunit sconB n=1 Tax=Exophiala mesophila TaxID=212818 RepID=A0A438MSY9_EXOME|nr:hypothetical protein B0A52_08997 [Exophiala mesophila]